MRENISSSVRKNFLQGKYFFLNQKKRNFLGEDIFFHNL